MRKKQEIKDIPVIMISASQNIKQVADKTGVNDFLAKPFDMQELINKVNKCLLSN